MENYIDFFISEERGSATHICVSSTKNTDMKYFLSDMILDHTNTSLEAQRHQVKFIKWFDNDHLMLANTQSEDEICKVINIKTGD